MMSVTAYMDMEFIQALKSADHRHAYVTNRRSFTPGSTLVRVAIVELPPSVTDDAFDAMTDAEREAFSGYPGVIEQPCFEDMKHVVEGYERLATALRGAAVKLADACERAIARAANESRCPPG